MIDFQNFSLEHKKEYENKLLCAGERGCEYSLVNLYLWGRQKAAQVAGCIVYFSQFNRKSVYLYPIGCGNKKEALDALMADAKERGIPCRLVGLVERDKEELEQLYPGKFRFHADRDSFDYIYDIEDLAELRGRKFQKKRNHLNRFREQNPGCTTEPISNENMEEVAALVEKWYALRLQENPHGDYHMERAALKKAMEQWDALGFEGLLLRTADGPVAMTVGSRLSEQTFDIHFEKALDIADGAYAAINYSFARYLREKYPEVRFLDREDDMGLEGLRKAKLSYCPHHMIEKCWACLLEDGYDY